MSAKAPGVRSAGSARVPLARPGPVPHRKEHVTTWRQTSPLVQPCPEIFSARNEPAPLFFVKSYTSIHIDRSDEKLLFRGIIVNGFCVDRNVNPTVKFQDRLIEVRRIEIFEGNEDSAGCEADCSKICGASEQVVRIGHPADCGINALATEPTGNDDWGIEAYAERVKDVLNQQV